MSAERSNQGKATRGTNYLALRISEPLGLPRVSGNAKVEERASYALL